MSLTSIVNLSALEGLRPISLNDIQDYKSRLTAGQHKAWCYFFPFLYLFSQSQSRTILISEDSGSLCLYMLRESSAKEPRLHLYFPPLPMNVSVLKRCLQRIHEFRRVKQAAILWIDGHHKESLSGVSGLTIKYRESEYLYDPKNFNDLSGGKFRKLRQNINKVKQLNNLEIRSYTTSDEKACRQLLKNWRNEQGERYEGNADSSYVKYCLKMADLFSTADLYGKVFSLQGKICSFGFVGETYPGMGNLFIGKSDHRIQGLNYFMQYEMIRSMQSYSLLNNASDMGYAGLKFAKEHLRPVAMHKVYKAKQQGTM